MAIYRRRAHDPRRLPIPLAIKKTPAEAGVSFREFSGFFLGLNLDFLDFAAGKLAFGDNRVAARGGDEFDGKAA